MKLVQKSLTALIRNPGLAVALAAHLTSCVTYAPPAPPSDPSEVRLISKPGRVFSAEPPGEVHPPPTLVSRKTLIRYLLVDCQRQLIPFVNLTDDPRAIRALEQLCPDSTAAQRAAVRSALHLLADGEFLERTKEQGGVAALAPKIRARAILREPSLINKPCLLAVIDETVAELFTNPFGF